jgi:hypothetical protein
LTGCRWSVSSGFRTGPTNVQLPVFVLYSGTATGEDYRIRPCS